MSQAYDEYLIKHKKGVHAAFNFLVDNCSEIFDIEDSELTGTNLRDTIERNVVWEHDRSKESRYEYDAYDLYFYGNKSYETVEAFRYAWLHHIHNNPHHWQYWVLINDDPDEGTIALDMPYEYIIEMICDWWSFSWSKNNLYEIFKWYAEHQPNMILSEKTQKRVDDILRIIHKTLKEMNFEEDA